MKRILRKILRIALDIWGVFTLICTLVGMFKLIARPKTYIAEQIRIVNDIRNDFKVENFG